MADWISALQSILRSSGLRNLFFVWMNFNLPFILLITFNAIGSADIVSSSTHPRYVTSEYCFIFMSLHLIFNWRIFFALRLLAKRIDFVLSSPKWILNLLSTNQSQMSLSHWVVSQFARRPYVGIGYMNHLHIKVELMLLLAAYR